MSGRRPSQPLAFPMGWFWAYLALLVSTRLAIPSPYTGGGTLAFTLYMAIAVFIPAVAIPPERLRDQLRPGISGWGWTLLLGAGVWILAAGLAWISGTLISLPLLRFQYAARGLGQSFLLLSAMAAVEELFFRAYLQEHVFARLWGTRGIHGLSLKNSAAAILFGLAHMAGGLSWFSPGHILGGLVYGRLVEHSKGRILPAIALHALCNMAILLFL